MPKRVLADFSGTATLRSCDQIAEPLPFVAVATLRDLLHKHEKDLFIWICFGLFIATFVTFWPSVRCEYVTWDDPDFITQNFHVQQGLTWTSLKWASTAVVASNWHPITTLTYLVGWQLWGFDPASDHFFDIILHAINVVVLFLLVRKLTGALWRSALVAALFALHPMRVESVTWIAERKDLLSAFFFFLTIWVYVDWVKQRRPWRYVLLSLMFVLGLLSKPMVVTLPFVLLLLDYWPLKRSKVAVWKLVLEKIPLFALSAIFSVLTYIVQQRAGSIAQLERWAFDQRLANALISYWRYIEKFIWPSHLSPLYLPSAHPSILWVSIAALMLVAVSIAILLRAPKSNVSTGWFWYLGMLVPVIGIIQVGSQSMADRYSYLPFIGLYFIIVWTVFDAVRKSTMRHALVLVSFLSLGVYAFEAHRQIAVWQNSGTLFRRMIDINPNNCVAHNGLGAYYVDQRRYKEAMEQFQIAISILPQFPDAQNNLGAELARQHKNQQAMAHFRAALDANPNFEMAHKNLAKVLDAEGDLDEAIVHYRKAYEIAPDRFLNANELGVCYFKKGDIADAATMFSKAVALAPNDSTTHANYGKALFALREINKSADEYAKAVSLSPLDADAQFHYGLLLAIQNNAVEAERHLREALRLKPNFADAEIALSKLRSH